MQSLVDTYQCEWKAVVNDPEKRRFFQQFANTDEAEPGVEFVTERGQQRPADWPSDFVPLDAAGAAAIGPAGRSRGDEPASDAAGCGSGRCQRLSRRRRPRRSSTATVADRRLPVRQPRRVVRLPEPVPAQAGDGAVARHPRRSAGRSQGRLPPAQEDVLARVGDVPQRGKLPGPGVPGQGRGGRRLSRPAGRRGARKPLGPPDAMRYALCVDRRPMANRRLNLEFGVRSMNLRDFRRAGHHADVV